MSMEEFEGLTHFAAIIVVAIILTVLVCSVAPTIQALTFIGIECMLILASSIKYFEKAVDSQ
jgi:type III secretory pathway component EscU